MSIWLRPVSEALCLLRRGVVNVGTSLGGQLQAPTVPGGGCQWGTFSHLLDADFYLTTKQFYTDVDKIIDLIN